MVSRDRPTVKTVLIEDDAGFAKTLAMLLDDAPFFKHQVQTAKFLEQAKQLIAASKPELIILDLILPNGRGVEVLHEIRKIAPKFEVALVVITGMADEDIEWRALDALADGFILKGREGAGEMLRVFDHTVLGLRSVKRLPVLPKGTAKEVRDLMKDCEANPNFAPFPEDKLPKVKPIA